MIPTIGLMIATYAIARLLQVPMEMFEKGSARWIVAAVISAGAIIVIGFFALDLLMRGTTSSPPDVSWLR
jgi:hypothetical protein